MISKNFINKLIILFIITINLSYSQSDSSEIYAKYYPVIKKIIAEARKDSASWERLAYYCDTFGNRLAGSVNLNKSLVWLEAEMKKDGLQNVRSDEVMVPNWKRGNEYLKLLSPWSENIPVLGLGGSVATPSEGITAPILVVKNFDDLKQQSDKAKGKIVVYNEPYKGYGDAVQYRFWGAVHAAEAGAVASLARSSSPNDMRHPHTGSMAYKDSVPKIPHASICEADALMLERMQKREQNPILKLYMESKTLPDTLSYNVIGELVGTDKPDEIIAFGGHSDCWDVGTGAHDDASGIISTLQALNILKNIGIKPKHTLRVVAWVNEENGLAGGKAYAEKHKSEPHKLVFEFDSGLFPPETIGYTGPDSLFYKFKTIEGLLQLVNDNMKVTKGGGGVDISPMMKLGVNSMSLDTKDDGKYFWYHHAPTDTADKIDPLDLNNCAAAIAISIYLYDQLFE